MQAKVSLKVANSEVHELILVTKNQAVCQAAEEQAYTELNTDSDAMPFQFSDKMFGDEEVGRLKYKQNRGSRSF